MEPGWISLQGAFRFLGELRDDGSKPMPEEVPMESKRERIKKALLAEMWEEKCPAPTLVGIEEVALKVRQWVEQRLAQFLLERHEAVWPAPGRRCGTKGAVQ